MDAGSQPRERRYGRILLLLFVLTLPLVNPIVHGDGVGYYAYARAPLIQHNLRFEEDWRHGNLNFAQSRTGADGQLLPEEFTTTGYVNNLFTIGPAMLWAPFLLVAHGVVLTLNLFGAHIPANGFSFPYILAMALGTVTYGFLGLLASYALARKYCEERWAFLATVAVWWGSSLPVYMYFNPAWSHAHSAFTVAAFLWYWDRTREGRTTRQWIALGLLGGLMVDVYFPNGVFLVVPLVESLAAYYGIWKEKAAGIGRVFGGNAAFLAAFVVMILPTLITRKIIFGGFFRLGAYSQLAWDWTAPFWRSVLFSADHGLLSWTPLLAVALIGLFLVPRPARKVAGYFGLGALAFYYVISSYPYWDGMASFGNRFFISLTPVYVFGLAGILQRLGTLTAKRGVAFGAATGLVACFVLWNLGLIYQWGTHLMPTRGPISFREAAYNQVFVVPRQLTGHLRDYVVRRGELMQKIEEKDMEQLKRDAQP